MTTTPHDNGKPTPADTVRQFLPLTVWLCPDQPPPAAPTRQPNQPEDHADHSHQEDPTCERHRQAVGDALARHLIEATTRPGDVLVDAFATSETVLRAAAGTARRAVACVPHFPLARTIGERLRATLPRQDLARLASRACRPDQMHLGVHDHLGNVALVVAAPPPYPPGPSQVTKTRACPACLSDVLTDAAGRVKNYLPAAWKVLRPGGTLAVVTTARHHQGRLVDPAPQTIRHARTSGFRYTQHVIAVRIPVNTDAPVVQATRTGLGQIRDIRSRALPPAARVHADVCLFTKPATTRTHRQEARR